MKKSGIQHATANFDASRYAVNGLQVSEVQELKDAFDILDVHKTSKIEPNDLQNLIKAFNFDGRNVSLELAIEQLLALKKPVDFQTFLNAFTAFYHGSDARQNYSKIFKLFDDERLGGISAKNLRRVVKQLGLSLKEDQIQLMIQRADVTNNGVVTEKQFISIMTKMSPKI